MGTSGISESLPFRRSSGAESAHPIASLPEGHHHPTGPFEITHGNEASASAGWACVTGPRPPRAEMLRSCQRHAEVPEAW